MQIFDSRKVVVSLETIYCLEDLIVPQWMELKVTRKQSCTVLLYERMVHWQELVENCIEIAVVVMEIVIVVQTDALVAVVARLKELAE